ncbi:hypothetical protein BJ875DRAFT_449779 [Amylocarpus encephaloides]|uniref:Uncharacterized protein n=1 Tax=Amylocarpus encephaloides TaxID=45428 RepID=A0A9P7YSC0_9HELO|nr:hypothetical protein BJ875DRAFT_449779 [Amylocarpus encephaloides]
MDPVELLKRLDAERNAYLNTLHQVHEALAQAVATSSSTIVTSVDPPNSPRPRKLSRFSVSNGDGVESLVKSSFVSGEDDASDDDEALYVQELLAKSTFDEEHLRNHLKTYEWNDYSKAILRTLFTKTARLKHPALFQLKPGEEGAHYSLYQIFDVGNDGAPLPLHSSKEILKEMSKDMVVWNLIKDVNVDPSRLRQAVGRITILREPSPIVFGAIHLTMNGLFDMDEIFKNLVLQGATTAYMKRAFDPDVRKQRTFLFSFEFFTIIGDECRPMSWQEFDKSFKRKEGHIQISRCSSVVALVLVGEPIKKIKNAARRAKTQYGYVYSPWSPWHVLNIECYPDWKSNTGSHDSTKHYVNGPEAFLNTLLVEFKDAEKRFEDLCTRIGKLVTPPADIMFNADLRDKLIFEDREFTYSRRYFWAFQTLATMNQGIKAMVDAYEETFTEVVWTGRHTTIWPLSDDSARDNYFKKRLAYLKMDFEHVIKKLKNLLHENDRRRDEIKDLRDNLFSGTSVLESRKSVEQTEITVKQGQNIKLLTLVNIFFLPLTFVTSVFGMTNMDDNGPFWPFAITLTTLCVPFFLLIGSMNTNRGMEFWTVNVGRPFVHLFKRDPKKMIRSASMNSESDNEKEDNDKGRLNKIAIAGRSLSAREGIKQRSGQFVSASTVEVGEGDREKRTSSPKRAITFGAPIVEEDMDRPRPPERRKTGDEILSQKEQQGEQKGAERAKSLNAESQGESVVWGEEGFWGRMLGRRKRLRREYSV